MYIRLTKTLADKGILVPAEELHKHITDYTIDWYYSPFMYGEEALEYYAQHQNSMKGYTGVAETSMLYWDLDCKEDFEKVRASALKLIEHLEDYSEGLEVYFSGNKGLHILLHTENMLNPQEVKSITQNIAVEAGLDLHVFDTSVYNVNRIFRVPYTRHPESKLYKIPLDYEALKELSEDEIRAAAKTQDGIGEVNDYVEVDITNLKEHYATLINTKTNELDFQTIREKYNENFNPMDCPADKRRCIYVLENGFFGPGERENATIRLLAYYRGHEKTREQAKELVLAAYEKRQANYEKLNPWTEADIERNLDQVYSPNWNGGTYTCRTDEYLRSKCDLGTGCCAEEKQKLNVVTIGGLLSEYEEYGNEALEEYPKTGIAWLDEHIRLRPKNFSIINGANGSSKTSLLILILESLNRQKMYHMFFSLDMANTSLLEKLAARHTKYSQREIEAAFNKHTRNPEIIQEVKDVLTEQYKYTLFDFTSTVTSEYIEEAVSALKYRERDPINIQMIFIDYAGRLTDDKDSEYANATSIALKANDVAKRLKVHSVYLSQIPREDGDHTDPIRSSRVSKNSGAWEENATVVINVWRPFGNGLKGLDNYLHLYIAKNRSGPLGERAFWWEGKTGDIRELDKYEFDEYYKLCEAHSKELPEPQFTDLGGVKEQYDQRPKEKSHYFDNDYDEDEEYLRNERNQVSRHKRFKNGGSGYSSY